MTDPHHGPSGPGNVWNGPMHEELLVYVVPVLLAVLGVAVILITNGDVIQ